MKKYSINKMKMVVLGVGIVGLSTAYITMPSCKKDPIIVNNTISPSAPPPSTNLIANSSFEDANGNPNAQGWDFTDFPAECVNEYVFIYNKEGAPNGGKRSLLIYFGTTQGLCPFYQPRVIYHLGKIQSGVYRLKAWTKLMCGIDTSIMIPCNGIQAGIQEVNFQIKNRATNQVIFQKIHVAQNTWTLCDTTFSLININSNDSLDFIIMSGNTPSFTKMSGSLIDLIELKRE